MKISYFAKVREQMGRDEDVIDFPDHVQNINDAILYLKTLGDIYVHALKSVEGLRFALDNEMMCIDAILLEHDELAIFSPVTGG